MNELERGKHAPRETNRSVQETEASVKDDASSRAEALEAERGSDNPDDDAAKPQDDDDSSAGGSPKHADKPSDKQKAEESESSEKSTSSKKIEIPTLDELRAERARHGANMTRVRIIGGVLGTLLVVAAVVTLVVTLWMPVLSVNGDSMAPTLQPGDMVACTNTVECQQGDVIAFYVDNRMLVKRVVATGGQVVDIDARGNVSVDGKKLEEPYVSELSLGNCDIKLPYQVPEDCYFVLGDNRIESLDSRSTAVGCAEQSKVVCKLQLRFWPLNRLGGMGQSEIQDTEAK